MRDTDSVAYLALCWGMHFSPIAVQINLTRKIRKEKKRKYNKGKQQQQQLHHTHNLQQLDDA